MSPSRSRWLPAPLRKRAKAVRGALATPEAAAFAPPGHFYSPVPDLDEVRRDATRIFDVPSAVRGIDLRQDDQLTLARRLAERYPEQPFSEQPEGSNRYHLDNEYFSHGDGLLLHLLLREVSPARLVEVGSGFSSAVILDTNERFLGGRLSCTFVEPYPDRLRSLLRADDAGMHELLEMPVQHVDLARFDALDAGDVLFIDSSHVSKVGSDVNHLLLEVLPRLRPGVVIHVHDVFYPFEYPPSWVYEGRAWNEAYLLRALLTDNPRFRILVWNSFLDWAFREEVASLMPLWARSPGTSLWLERIGD